MRARAQVSIGIVTSIVAFTTWMTLPAQAAGQTTVITGTTVLVTGTAADDSVVGVECLAGNIAPFKGSLSGGPLACTAVTSVTVNGGAGDDFVLIALTPAEAPALTTRILNGQDGADRVDGSDATDLISGGAGNDVFRGIAGSDVIGGGAGTDAFVNEESFPGFRTLTDTSFTNSASTMTLSSIESARVITGSDANVITTTGFSGSVEVHANGGIDTITTGPGNDIVDGGSQADVLNAGDGDDLVTAGAADASNDSLIGGLGSDTMDLGGADLVVGPTTVTSSNAGTDSYGGFEKAQLTVTGTSSAAAFAGPTLWLLFNTVAVTGSPQADTFQASDSSQGSIDGGGGTDAIVLGNGLNSSFTDAAVADNQLTHTGFFAGTKITSLASIERLVVRSETAADGADVDASAFSGQTNVTLDAGSNTVLGGSTRDVVKTGASNDSISGNGGNDSMNGGRGTDTCNGGAGKDTVRSCELGSP